MNKKKKKKSCAVEKRSTGKSSMLSQFKILKPVDEGMEKEMKRTMQASRVGSLDIMVAEIFLGLGFCTKKLMSAVSEGPIPFDHVSQEENSSDPVDAVIFFGISLVIGIASRHLLRGTRVPYTVALLVLGVALGSIEYGTNHGLGRVGDGIRIWANINPDLLLAVFLPALLF
ncbi:sodium/hydrogen exchanger 8 [Cinnamomum micranthum f. kanehirae]|uniref:Sodium/hydrogen exchanger 8 n=1 Tax=Cinnamomum micranthum f. kanehirae TaxID=337451 RepID=A0A3S3NP13_9MAGN|nr:sodium/hydrogen exchanger 8 [Cinnamomum micranthum f. kanehirae]